MPSDSEFYGVSKQVIVKLFPAVAKNGILCAHSCRVVAIEFAKRLDLRFRIQRMIETLGKKVLYLTTGTSSSIGILKVRVKPNQNGFAQIGPERLQRSSWAAPQITSIKNRRVCSPG